MPKVALKIIRQYTGIPEPTLSRWIQQKIIPDDPDLAVVTTAVVNHYKQQLKAKIDKTEKDPLYQEKVRETKARADKLEIENELTAGELVLVNEVEKTWLSYLMACRSHLLAVPSRLALELSGMNDPNQIQDRIEQEIYQALEELSNQKDG